MAKSSTGSQKQQTNKKTRRAKAAPVQMIVSTDPTTDDVPTLTAALKRNVEQMKVFGIALPASMMEIGTQLLHLKMLLNTRDMWNSWLETNETLLDQDAMDLCLRVGRYFQDRQPVSFADIQFAFGDSPMKTDAFGCIHVVMERVSNG